MKDFYHKGSKNFPDVILNPELNLFSISGDITHYDCVNIFEEIFDWLDEYLENPLFRTVFKFKVLSFNTISLLLIFRVILKLQAINDMDKELEIHWCYDQSNEIILEKGKEFKKMFMCKFKLIEEISKENKRLPLINFND
jgi:hypothetical protein